MNPPLFKSQEEQLQQEEQEEEEEEMAPKTTPITSSGYTAEDVNFGRLYKVATQTSKRVLKGVFQVILQRGCVASGINLSVSPVCVSDYCIQALGWSNTKYRQSFNSDERSVLQEPIGSADMDVSLLSKLIHKLFDDLNVPEMFRAAVRDVKNMRNKVCHQHLVLDEDQLVEHLDELKGIYCALFDQVREVFAVEMDEDKRMYCAEVDEIKSACVKMEEPSEYFVKVEQFRLELTNRFITQGRKELMTRYSKLQVLNPFTWVTSEHFPQLQVGRIFTPLLITNKNRNINITSLLIAENVNEDKDIEEEEEEEEEEDSEEVLPHVLMLSGIAGCGKTSLCRYLLHDWRMQEDAVVNLKTVDVLLYIEARNVTCTSIITLLQKTLLPNTSSQFEEKDIVQILRQVRVLYVIDGMDEATPDAKVLIKDVFSLGSNTSRIIVTTRPEYQADVMQLADHHHLTHMKLSVHGFSYQGTRIFTSRVFAVFIRDEKRRRAEEAEFLSFLRTSCTGLAGHLKLPLTLALLVCLWHDDKKRMAKITSATRLYSEIFRLCTTKLATRLQSTKEGMHSMRLQSFVDSWLLALGEEAYRMLDEGRLIIDDDTQRQLSGLCESKGLSSVQVFSAFLHCDVHSGLLGVQHRFSFVHKSQMEYLAALHVSNKVLKAYKSESQTVKTTMERLSIFKGSLKKKNTNLHDIVLFSGWGAKWVNTWLFVVGHLCLLDVEESVVRTVLKVIVSAPPVSRNEKTMWRLVEESGRHELVRELVGDAMMREYKWQPSEEELCDPCNPVSMLMQYTSFTPHTVILRVIASLNSVLLVSEGGRVHTGRYENLDNILTCLSRRPKCYVYLKLDEQYYTWGGKETADRLLELLKPAGNVVSLTSHLGPRGAAALTSVTEMVVLNIRVSDTETLHLLSNGLLKRAKVFYITLRLDLPLLSIVPDSLPTIPSTQRLHIILNRVQDSNASTTARVMSKLCKRYGKVDLVASVITPDGLGTFIAGLEEGGVTLEELSVRSRVYVEEEKLQQLKAMLPGKRSCLHWLN